MTVNFICGRAMNFRLFKAFCNDLGKEHQYLFFHIEVRWLLWGKVLSCVAELVTEVAVLLREHGSVELATLFDDNRFQLKVFCLEGIISLLNELSYSLLGKTNLKERLQRTSLPSKKVITMEKESKKLEFCYVFTVGQ